MKASLYKHSCVISRSNGWDENGDETFTDLYSGSCLYQAKFNAIIAGGLVQSSPVCFLPSNDILFDINDKVVITVEKGRVITAFIETVRDLSGGNVNGTRLELKQARDDG